MQTKTPPPLPSVVKHEDKMETLRSFILAALLAPGSGDGGGVLSVVARSVESPVARALVAVGSELVNRGVTVRAIFSQLEPEKTPAGWSVAGPEICFQRDLRWAKNQRLGDAHEQLVLNDTVSWTGDCMRRDPSRRDAYEHFVTSDERTTRTLRLSFERLWEASLPLAIRTATRKHPAGSECDGTGSALATLLPRDDNSGPLVSSSH